MFIIIEVAAIQCWETEARGKSDRILCNNGKMGNSVLEIVQ